MARLGDVCNIQSGGTPSRGVPEYWENGQIPWVKISDIKDKYINATEECITDIALNNSSAKIFPKGTILFTIFATLGETSILQMDAATNQAIACLQIINKQLLSDYLYYYLLSKKAFVNNLGRGVAQNNINLKILRDFEIAIPPLNIQNNIIEQLNQVVNLIDLREKQLQQLDGLVKSRFIETFGNFVFDRNRWSTCKVGDVAITIDPQPSHRTPPVSTDGIPYIGVSDCNYDLQYIDFCKARKVGQDVLQEHLKRYTLNEGDFIIGKIGTIGKPFFVPSKQDYTLSANTVLIKPIKEKISPQFLFEIFQSEYMDLIIDTEKKSTSQPAFGIQKIRQISIPLPPMELQMQFALFVKQVLYTKTIIKKSLKKFEALKKQLMQDYFG